MTKQVFIGTFDLEINSNIFSFKLNLYKLIASCPISCSLSSVLAAILLDEINLKIF